MTGIVLEAFKKAQNLPDYLQNELAEQLIEDVENEIKWQQSLSQPQGTKLDTFKIQTHLPPKNHDSRRKTLPDNSNSSRKPN